MGGAVMTPPRMVVADTPDRGRMPYLVDDDLDFIPEVKAFLDWKAATRRAPDTLHAYCYRLWWYYRFLHQHRLDVRAAGAADLTEFLIWLCNPHREAGNVAPIHTPSSLQASTVNQILQVVAAFYRFLVRRGVVTESPVVYVDVPRGAWLTERDLLAHTRRGAEARTVPRLELQLKEPRRRPATVSEREFRTFLESIRVGRRPS